ncbi:MAG: NUDIX domain-containing protein [Nitrospina sp.]|jgi:8-oxo-dGTP diphosphatase|nr:NUDIX domain-containing protein [Nitrospina sp.]
MPNPIVVKAIIYNQNKLFLLQHRDNVAGIIEPNCWSFFGGGVEGDESLTGALERELQEELSCKVGQLEGELFRWIQPFNNTLHVCFAVRFMASNDDLILTEGQNFSWFSLSEMENLPLGLLVRANFSYLTNLFTSKHIFAAIGAQNVRNIDIP